MFAFHSISRSKTVKKELEKLHIRGVCGDLDEDGHAMLFHFQLVDI